MIMKRRGEIVSVNISEKKGTVKKPVTEIVIDERGIVGDAHAAVWHRQVSLLSQESIDRFAAMMERSILPGEFAENLAVRGFSLRDAAVLDRFVIGEVELELTQIGKECHGDSCAIFREVGKCVMPKEGVFCRVVRGGTVRAGDTVEHIPRPLRILVVTLSDRAHAGEYADRSGPRAQQLLEEFFEAKRWHRSIERALLPDDAEQLRATLEEALQGKTDVIFTLGGTGVGPRDIAPETVTALCDKLIPGIMENIRAKYGVDKPSVFLSRSVAAVCGTTQVYTLPGSVRAVEEYLAEILKTLEHMIYMIHGLDTH
jgi:molybdenum cofactor synthesis domain-containing protein